MSKIFEVYEVDEDDIGCVRIHVNTDIPYVDVDATHLLVKLIEFIDEMDLEVLQDIAERGKNE